ncbi:2-dehydro-3-deoxygalactonokinase [Tahibacter harae]|uniref:2-dehydro-3-deoxygalactonokinase n=1 Tax=Tahibacter harae TaxID=2963937 RepID=A0ABT1QT97_9GAMM|nr:2-dehydro-3-deoxygalactonokinase [Tahibacter harae]MCQ4165499.1 2-dehydro-3-deoxygalactonokinase [Tahibacter harae]
MRRARFIAGDWGTSHLRLALCAEDGAVLAEARGPGAAACNSRFAEVLAQAAAPWAEHGRLPALLCGMVGSRLGWKEAPYLPCPASLEQLAQGCIAPGMPDVRILPGLRCTNPLGAADFLRGEETQVLGALALDARLRTGRHLLVLPGTHSKWLQLDAAQVRQFQTFVTGEIYAALHAHSVLVTPAAAAGEIALDGAFLRGLQRSVAAPPDALLAQLFECRARRLAGEMAEDEASEFLSGLLIGHELRQGLAQHAAAAHAPPCLIGTPALTRRYAYALSVFDIDSTCMDGGAAAIAGLAAVHRQRCLEQA